MVAARRPATTGHDERVFVHGPSGTGKSSLIRQIASLVKRPALDIACQGPVRRVSLNGETSVADFVGHWTVNDQRQSIAHSDISYGREPVDRWPPRIPKSSKRAIDLATSIAPCGAPTDFTRLPPRACARG